MSKITGLLTALSEQIAKQSRREQLLLLAAVLAVIVAPWYSFVAKPMWAKEQTLRQQIVSTGVKNSQLQVQSSEVMTRHQADPDLENRLRLAQLQKEIQQSTLRLQQMTLGLIPPKEMAQVLEEVLQRQGGLRLIKLENLAALALTPAGGLRYG